MLISYIYARSGLSATVVPWARTRARNFTPSHPAVKPGHIVCKSPQGTVEKQPLADVIFPVEVI